MTLSTKSTTAWAEVDENGRLILPPEMAQHYGLTPGGRVIFFWEKSENLNHTQN
jgi:bifunctional DNA-binding transcriptional regulator/antitoxin component of YhaV-PrlF toxin-antitoxin module